MKKFISLILSAAFLLPLIIFNVAASGFSTEDALKILRFSIGASSISAEEKARYDIDGDGKITSSDALEVLRIVAGINSPVQDTAPLTLKPLLSLSENVQRTLQNNISEYVFRNGSLRGAQVTTRDVLIKDYLGNYNGFQAIELWVYRNQEVYNLIDRRTLQLKIDDFTFKYNGDKDDDGKELDIYLYKDFELLDVGGAYEQGLISRNDVYNIHHNYSKIWEKENPKDLPNEPLYPQTPSPSISLKALTKEEESRIIDDYTAISTFSEHHPNPEVYIVSYHGEYNGYKSVRMWARNAGWAVSAGSHGFTLDGFDFVFPSGFTSMYLYKDSSFIDLYTGYESGLISKNDLHNIHFHYDIRDYARNGTSYYANPLPPTPFPNPPKPRPLKALSADIRGDITKAFASYWNRTYSWSNIAAEDVRVSGYYGTYNGYVVCSIYNTKATGTLYKVLYNIDGTFGNGSKFMLEPDMISYYIEGQYLHEIEYHYAARFVP